MQRTSNHKKAASACGATVTPERSENGKIVSPSRLGACGGREAGGEGGMVLGITLPRIGFAYAVHLFFLFFQQMVRYHWRIIVPAARLDCVLMVSIVFSSVFASYIRV